MKELLFKEREEVYLFFSQCLFLTKVIILPATFAFKRTLKMTCQLFFLRNSFLYLEDMKKE